MRPEYRNNLDDAPRQVAAMAKTFADGDVIPLHMHRRGQLLHADHRHHAGRDRGRRLDRAAGARAVAAARLAAQRRHARRPGDAHDLHRSRRMRGLPPKPVLVEISGLLRELILALLEEPLDYDESGRGGTVARLILTELGRLQERRLDVPMPRDPRALRVARALLDNSGCRRRSRPLGRTGRRQPAHAGAPVPQRDRPGLCRMARPPARHRWARAPVGRRLGGRDAPIRSAMPARAPSRP